MPRAKEMLVNHLSPESASSLKALALVRKAYLAAGEATASLHTTSILQAYQADLLKDMCQSEEVSPDAIRGSW